MTDMTIPPHLQPTRSISRAQLFLIHVFGPADSWDNPLVGTQYDPRLGEHRQREAVARRRARAAERALRRDKAAFRPALRSLPQS